MSTPAILVGLGIGDALGMPFESRGDAVHKDLPLWDGGYWTGTHHELPAGHWTDDTEMAVALATSILDIADYQPPEAAVYYRAWYQGTPHGMGGTTRKAMANLEAGAPWLQSGVEFDDPNRVGNGTAMRVAPIASWFHAEPEYIHAAATNDAMITHRGPEAAAGSFAIAWAVHRSLDGTHGPRLLYEVLEIIRPYKDTKVFQLVELAYELAALSVPPAEAIRRLGRFGNVSQTVATALYCAAWYEDDFAEGVCAAVRGGGDTDTRGAITGAILGARFGLEGIPDRYKSGLYQFETLRKLDAALLSGSAKGEYRMREMTKDAYVAKVRSDLDRFSKWWDSEVAKGAPGGMLTEDDWQEQFDYFRDDDGIEVH